MLKRPKFEQMFIGKQGVLQLELSLETLIDACIYGWFGIHVNLWEFAVTKTLMTTEDEMMQLKKYNKTQLQDNIASAMVMLEDRLQTFSDR